ncbi:MAG: Plastocyanin [Owenweeksia sp. TMED14]|nr:MAG: Plastocyanin [Owenweeksia sp. TMED14]
MKNLYSLLLSILSLSAFATNHNVSVTNMSFSPSSLSINQGDTVTWTQVNGTHNVNGNQSIFPTNPASFGSGSAIGGTWVYAHSFSGTGVYNYHCDPHSSSMIGSITVNPGPCSDLFISEYIEGSGSNKAIEIYNPTATTINLSNYSINAYNNGNTTITNGLSLPNHNLASGDVYVIVNPSADPNILAQADTTSAITYFNGDDAIVLFNNTDTIDIIGVVGIDPGSDWTVDSGSTANHTLVRKSPVTSGQLDWSIGASEWDIYASNTFSYIGSHSNSCVTGGGSGPLPGVCSDLFFSEYGEGSSNHKYVEIYNPTSSAISLSGYTVYLSGNGGSYTNTFTSNASIASGDVYLVCTNQADTLIQAASDTILSYPSIVHFNGDDALILFDGTDTIDVLGVPGVDPGSSWAVGSGSTANHTLVRMSNVTGGSTDWTTGALEWDVYPQNTWSFIGAHASSCSGGGGGPTSPSIRFTSSSSQVLEGNIATFIDLYIQPTLTNVSSVNVRVSPGSGFIVGTDATINPNISSTGTMINIPANSDTISIAITVIDDAINEGTEYADFIIQSVGSGLTIGVIDSMRFTINDDDTPIPTYTIPQIKGQDSDGVSDSLGVYCKVIGTVIGVNTQSASTGNVAFTIHDGTVGFGVFSPSTSSHGYTVTEGDVIRVVGSIGQFNGLAQVGADSISIISTGAGIPSPTVITSLDETTESNLLRVNNVTVVDPTQWTNAGSGFNVDVFDGINTIALRIDADVTLFNEPCPTGVFNIIGIGGQFDMSSPYTGGYQMLPRQKEDVIFPTPTSYDLAITEIMSGSNDPNVTISEDWFEIHNYGNTAIDLSGFSWDDNSYTPGTSVFTNTTLQPGNSVVVWKGMSANKGDFRGAWGISNAAVQIIASDELVNGAFPSLSSTSDAVALYDTSASPIEICRADYLSSIAGSSVEFDTNCSYLGNSVAGIRGAYVSTGGDIGSPGDEAFPYSLPHDELVKIKLFPNPASGSVNLHIPIVGTKIVRVINTLGQNVYFNETEKSILLIDTEKFHNGIFLVQIQTSQGEKTLRLVVQQ